MSVNMKKYEAAVARFKLMGVNNPLIWDIQRNIKNGYDMFLIWDIFEPKGLLRVSDWVECLNFIKAAGGSSFVFAESSTASMRYLHALFSIPSVEVLSVMMVGKDVLSKKHGLVLSVG